MINCVYILTFANGKRYVGQSSDPERRVKQHATSKRAVGHAWRKYGRPDIQIAFSGSAEACKAREIMLIENPRTHTLGYNLTPGGGGGSGNHSPETRRKMSTAHMGHRHSEETRRKISEANSDPSPETRRKISEAKRGKKQSAEHIESSRKAQTGKKLSEEHKRKMSFALMENKNGLGKSPSEETRRKLSKALKGNQNANRRNHDRKQ